MQQLDSITQEWTGRAASAPPRRTSDARSPVAHGNHAVQFYDNEAFLATGVSEYVGAGLTAGEQILVIATQDHRKGLLPQLASQGIDTDAARRSGQLTMLDASETLSTFMAGEFPDATQFHATVGRAMEEAVRRSRGGGVRAYGEMVDLLWREENPRGAIRLEELWNELATKHTFSLLCTYAMDHFRHETQRQDFADVCRQHAQVIPTESYTQIPEYARAAEIARLQQRAAALEVEVAQRKTFEQQLRSALAERDDLLRREQMARMEAEVANQAKAAFLAMMSHELRTPLNAIGGYAELIDCGVYGPVTEEQRTSIARIQRSQQHLLTLINDVLNFAKINMGHIEYNTTPVSIAELFASVEELVTLQCMVKGISCFFQPRPIAVIADADRIRQVLLNLLSNAMKFTEAGGTVTVSACDAEAHMIGIEVRDTGRGIPDGQLASIFDPFVQAGRTLNQPCDGVGLGLTISRDLTRGMGGDLTVTSHAGVGSTFTVTLPRA